MENQSRTHAEPRPESPVIPSSSAQEPPVQETEVREQTQTETATQTSPEQSPTRVQAQFMTPPPEPQPTYLQALRAGDQHGLWKLGLRIVLLIIALIGLGCCAASASSANNRIYGYFGNGAAVWGIITFGASIIWCIIVSLVYVIRKRPAHPGLLVGVDLILWLAYILTALLLTVAALDALHFSPYDISYAFDSSDGEYILAPNGTLVWNATMEQTYIGRPDGYYGDNTNNNYYWDEDAGEYVYYPTSSDSSNYAYFPAARDCNDTSNSGYSSYYANDVPAFADCAEQDAYVNSVFASRKSRASVILTATVTQYIALVLHFTLFVWACVDTHRRNRSKTTVEAQDLANRILGEMVQRGQVVVTAPQSAYMPLGSGPDVQMRDMRASGAWQGQQRASAQQGGWPLANVGDLARGGPLLVQPQQQQRMSSVPEGQKVVYR